MCGILGVVAPAGRSLSVSLERIEAIRDRELAHRGPDGAGAVDVGGAVFAHRRLAVLDPSDAGAQPWTDGPEGDRDRFVLVYNGELYNDAVLRDELSKMGRGFRTGCDTETLMAALMTWGTAALPRLRGMYAFAFYDRVRRMLLIARDPLGVKPLYYSLAGGELSFASEVRALLALPGVGAAPNAGMVSAYLTTIRTTLGRSTMFEDIRSLRAGELAIFDLSGDAIQGDLASHWQGQAELTEEVSQEVGEDWTGRMVRESVLVHLRSDVPTCALLSGGLDSSVIAQVAQGAMSAGGGRLRTYAAGAAVGGPAGADLPMAELVADALGTSHAEAVLDEAMFDGYWELMVGAMRLPLSTPNETAIYAVASRLREDGCVVTLSGEGADELFAGYELPMSSAAEYLASPAGKRVGPGRFQLESAAWIAPSMKSLVLNDEWLGRAGGDAGLTQWYEQEFEACAQESGGDGLAAHLRFHRRVNLVGLLQRLDTATMLAGVEGRTPFSDHKVAQLAESLPMGLKYRAAEGGRPAVTKGVLRGAFRGVLPREVVDRTKASFPLPFEAWMGRGAERLRGSAFAREVFRADAIEQVADDPGRHWNLAWPMINLAMWGESLV